MQSLLSAHRKEVESNRSSALSVPILAPPRFHHVPEGGYFRTDSIIYLNDAPRDIDYEPLVLSSVASGLPPPIFSRYDAVTALACQITVVYRSPAEASSAALWWRSVQVPTGLALFPCLLRVTSLAYLEHSFNRLGFFTPDPGMPLIRRAALTHLIDPFCVGACAALEMEADAERGLRPDSGDGLLVQLVEDGYSNVGQKTMSCAQYSDPAGRAYPNQRGIGACYVFFFPLRPLLTPSFAVFQVPLDIQKGSEGSHVDTDLRRNAILAQMNGNGTGRLAYVGGDHKNKQTFQGVAGGSSDIRSAMVQPPPKASAYRTVAYQSPVGAALASHGDLVRCYMAALLSFHEGVQARIAELTASFVERGKPRWERLMARKLAVSRVRQRLQSIRGLERAVTASERRSARAERDATRRKAAALEKARRAAVEDQLRQSGARRSSRLGQRAVCSLPLSSLGQCSSPVDACCR